MRYLRKSLPKSNIDETPNVLGKDNVLALLWLNRFLRTVDPFAYEYRDYDQHHLDKMSIARRREYGHVTRFNIQDHKDEIDNSAQQDRRFR